MHSTIIKVHRCKEKKVKLHFMYSALPRGILHRIQPDFSLIYKFNLLCDHIFSPGSLDCCSDFQREEFQGLHRSYDWDLKHTHRHRHTHTHTHTHKIKLNKIFDITCHPQIYHLRDCVGKVHFSQFWCEILTRDGRL